MRKKLVALLTSVSIFFSSFDARADALTVPRLAYDGTVISVDLSTNLSSTTTLVATTVGLGYLVVLLMISAARPRNSVPRQRPPPGDGETQSVEIWQLEQKAQQAAAFFLKDNAVGLARDLAVGEGPVLNLIAANLAIPVSHRSHMGQLLQAHHAELSDLASVEQLTPVRAGKFVERFVEILSAEKTLAADLQRFALAQAIN